MNDGEPIECLTDEVKDAIMKNIRRRMTPQPVKIRADVELTCFSYDGILHIQVHMLVDIVGPCLLQHHPEHINKTSCMATLSTTV